MENHSSRYKLILATTLAVIVALSVAGIAGAPESVLTAFVGALGILVPAVVDAHTVEQRRVTPGESAIKDDVRGVDASF